MRETSQLTKVKYISNPMTKENIVTKIDLVMQTSLT